MTKAKVEMIYDEMMEAINKIAEKYNIKTNGARVNYSESEFNLTVKMNIMGDDGKKVITSANQSRAAWALMSTSAHGCDNPLGKKITISEIGECTIVDYNSRCSRYPFIVENSRGKQWKVTAKMVGDALTEAGF